MRLPLGPELLVDSLPSVEGEGAGVPSAMGAFPLLMLIGKGVASGGNGAVRNAAGNALDNLAEDVKRREAKAKAERLRRATLRDLKATVARYREEVRQAPSSEARERSVERLRAAEDRLEEAVARAQMTKRGLDDSDACAVLEFRRNLLAASWKKALPERKKVIEQRVAEMDARLSSAHRARQEAEKIHRNSGSAAKVIAEAKRRPPPSKRRLSGEGGLSFEVMSPPGPGRLCRLPFYPVNVSQSWLGTGGIDEDGDCPVLDLKIPVGSRTVGPYLMRTPYLDYGEYRILGVQVDFQTGYRHTVVGGGADDVAIALSDFTVYNGKELFPQGLGSGVDARTFMVRQLGNSNFGPSAGTAQERPFVWDRRRSRFFAGLRDYPVINSSSQATVSLRAFTKSVIGGRDLRVPVTANLVVEILQDRIYGDIENPGPSARAGALVKVGTRPQGVTVEGRERLELVSSRYVPPR